MTSNDVLTFIQPEAVTSEMVKRHGTGLF